MKPRNLFSRLIVATLLGFLPATIGGCGFALTRAPPQGHEQMEYFTCTESNAGPILDAVSAGLSTLNAIVCGSDPGACGDSDSFAGPSSETYVATGAVFAVLYGASAVVGFNKTEKCRDAKRQLAERLARDRRAERDQPGRVVVQSVVLSPSADTLAVGEQVQLTATAYDSSGAAIASRRYVWSSSNDAIASVSDAGLVTAHANGAVAIAARTDNVVGIANIVVVSPQ